MGKGSKGDKSGKGGKSGKGISSNTNTHNTNQLNNYANQNIPNSSAPQTNFDNLSKQMNPNISKNSGSGKGTNSYNQFK